MEKSWILSMSFCSFSGMLWKTHKGIFYRQLLTCVLLSAQCLTAACDLQAHFSVFHLTCYKIKLTLFSLLQAVSGRTMSVKNSGVTL